MRLIFIFVAFMVKDVLSSHNNKLGKSNHNNDDDDNDGDGFYSKVESKRSASKHLDEGFFAESLSSVSFKEEEKLKVYQKSMRCLKRLLLVYKQLNYATKKRVINKVKKMQSGEVTSLDLELHLSREELERFGGYMEQFEKYSTNEAEDSLSQQVISFCEDLQYLEIELYHLMDRIKIQKTRTRSVMEIIHEWIPKFDREQIFIMLPMVIFITVQLTFLVYSYLYSTRKWIVFWLVNLIFSSSLVQYYIKSQFEYEKEWDRQRNRVLSYQCSNWFFRYFNDCKPDYDDYKLTKHDSLLHFLLDYFVSLYFSVFDHVFSFLDLKFKYNFIYWFSKPIYITIIFGFILIYSANLFTGISQVQRIVFGWFKSPLEASPEERSHGVQRLESSPINSAIYYFQTANITFQKDLHPELQLIQMEKNLPNLIGNEDEYFSAHSDDENLMNE